MPSFTNGLLHFPFLLCGVFFTFFLVAEGEKVRFSASIKYPWISVFPSRGSDIDLEIPNNRIRFIPHSEMAETVGGFLIRELNEAQASGCSGPSFFLCFKIGLSLNQFLISLCWDLAQFKSKCLAASRGLGNAI